MYIHIYTRTFICNGALYSTCLVFTPTHFSEQVIGEGRPTLAEARQLLARGDTDAFFSTEYRELKEVCVWRLAQACKAASATSYIQCLCIYESSGKPLHYINGVGWGRSYIDVGWVSETFTNTRTRTFL